MKRDTDKIQRTLAAKLKIVEFTTTSNSSDLDMRTKRQLQQGSTRCSLLPDECIFCRIKKNKNKKRIVH